MNSRTEQRKLAAILFTDMVGSTALKQQLGDKAGLQLIAQHHELLRQTLQQFADAQEIKAAGDSFFLSFPTPSAAVSFALRLQERLRQFNVSRGVSVEDRVGVHLGEVSLQGTEDVPDLHGLHVDLCARVMGLAQGGQILMTRAVFDSARQTLKGEDLEGVADLNWVSHGRYLLKGLDEPVEICEVAESGQGALRPPDTTEKARRHTSPEEEPVLGWRPAVGQQVGRTDWVLEEKLGEGGFGEVWVGRHRRLKERRVFKFCFRADRARSLKREMTLFRLIKERIGDHPNIVSLREVYFDEPPYYVEMDYAEGQDLANWCAGQGGADKVALETKLEIVAQVAEALQAAHECGVIHRDVKPGNILVGTQKAESRKQKAESGDAQPSALNPQLAVKLTDFGIGQVISGEYLADVTKAGFTQTMMSSSSSHTGTQLYLAPELMAGEPATTRSDLYSLGVVLYQLVLGAFNRPLTSDWAEDIGDPLLREDIRHCVAGKPADRFAGAGQLAKHLRDYAPRKAALERQQAEKAALERAAYRRGMMRTAGVATVIVAVMAGLALVALNQSKRARIAAGAEKQARQRAEEYLYDADMVLAQQALDTDNLGRVRELLEKYQPAATSVTSRTAPPAADLRGWEWRYLWSRSRGDELYTLGSHRRVVDFVVFSDDGSLLATSSQDRCVKMWDMAARRELATVRFPVSPADLCFVPRSRTVAVAVGKEVLLLDGSSGQKTGVIPCGADVGAAAFSRDGNRLAVHQGRTLRMLDAQSRGVIWQIAMPAAWRLTFSPDHTLLAAATEQDQVVLLDAVSGQQLASLPGFHGSYLGSLVFSPDGGLLACASGDRGPVVRIYDVKKRQELRELELQEGRWFGGVAFSPDGKIMAVSGGPHVITLVDPQTWKVTGHLQGHLDEAWALAFSPDGRTLACGSKDATVRVWNPDLKQLKRFGDAELELPGDLDAGKLSTDGSKLCVLTTNHTFAVWETATLRQLSEGPIPFRNILHTGAGGWTLPWAISSDGRRLFNLTRTGQILIWDTVTREALVTLETQVPSLQVLTVSPDEKKLAVAGDDRIVRLWDLQRQTLVTNLPAGPSKARSLVFSLDGQVLAVGFLEGELEAWHLHDSRKLLSCHFHTMLAQTLAISPNRRFLAASGVDSRVTLWDLEKGTLIKAFTGALNSYNCVAISEDSRRVFASGGPGTVSVWDTETLQSVGTLKGHRRFTGGLSMLPGGNTVVSLGYETVDLPKAHLWRAPSWAEIEAIKKGRTQKR